MRAALGHCRARNARNQLLVTRIQTLLRHSQEMLLSRFWFRFQVFKQEHCLEFGREPYVYGDSADMKHALEVILHPPNRIAGVLAG